MYTAPGPNLMINYRNVNIGNFLRIPLTWAHQVYTMIRYSNRLKKEYTTSPAGAFNARVVEKAINTLCKGGRLTKFDESLYNWFIKNV